MWKKINFKLDFLFVLYLDSDRHVNTRKEDQRKFFLVLNEGKISRFNKTNVYLHDL